MRRFAFTKVDVFTRSVFGGNPLAVFPDARGLSAGEMLALTGELNLSETAFVLPPREPGGTARVRIFSRAGEMPFAGHPLVGTAFVLASRGLAAGGTLRFEVPAGRVEVRLERDAGGAVTGAAIDAPQPLAVAGELDRGRVAACLGLETSDVVTRAHAPVRAGVGVAFVIAEVTPAALARAMPGVGAMRALVAAHGGLVADRLALFAYVRASGAVAARMFAPLAGTWEDPATGSAHAALAALLLSLSDGVEGAFEATQGVELGRPSRVRARAWRRGGAVWAGVAGDCAPVLEGTALL